MSPPRHSEEEAIETAGEPQNGSSVHGALSGDMPLKTDKDAEANETGTEDKMVDRFDDLSKNDNNINEKEPVQNDQDDTLAIDDGSAKNVPEISEELIHSPLDEESRDVPAAEEGQSLLIDPMESSTSTLKPEASQAIATQYAIKDENYLDPTPQTPHTTLPEFQSSPSNTNVPQHGQFHGSGERSPTRSDIGFDEKQSASEDERDGESRSEIQSIMDQFSEEGGGPGVDEVMSPRLEFANPLLGPTIQHPPRKSSLEPLSSAMTSTVQNVENLHITSGEQASDIDERGPPVPPKAGSMHHFNPPRNHDERFPVLESPMSPPATALHRPPPPEPEPEPDLPFDFHRFLEQLRHRTADPVAKFLRSFLQEFGKKQWMVHEQVKIIADFLAFITNKMGQCEVWREVSDAEFDNAREGMEKLVMNRLYTQTFSPAIPPPQPIPGARSRRKNGERPLGPGRRGQHQEDVERDEVLAQKVSIYGWVKEQHLDIQPVGDSGKRFLVLAQQELLKIKTYRAPRDKIICVLNCCKVIMGLLKHSKSDSSADSFIPLLIYVVLQANPEHLVSNVQYILRFRNQEKLGGEAGYYLSSLMGAIQFIENLDRTTLTISDEEFEKNVEAAVSAIAEKHEAEEAPIPPPRQVSEKSTPSRPEITTRNSLEGESSIPRKSTSSYDTDSGDGAEETAAMTGLLRTIQRPLSSIGRIFSDETATLQTGPARTPQPGNTPRLSPAPRRSGDVARSPNRGSTLGREDEGRTQLSAEEAAARQASAEAAEARRIQRAEHENVVETLAGMFPDLDREIISDVVVQANGRVGLAVDACLALSS